MPAPATKKLRLRLNVPYPALDLRKKKKSQQNAPSTTAIRGRIDLAWLLQKSTCQRE
jgi:hypothetical protein